jgi:DNA polymerase III sliding clamp (beta) subunit (PCNA family)
MDTLKYVEIAKSRDEGRYNLTGIYRDTERLVATDGHRLHMVEGLSKIDKPHFLDGRDSDFPCYETVLLKNPTLVCSVKFEAKDIKRMKAFLSMYDRKISRGVWLSCSHQKGLVIETTEEEKGWSASMRFSCEESRCDRAFKIGIDLQYVIEALVPMKTFAAEFYVENATSNGAEASRALNIVYPILKSTALIMGMGLEEPSDD